MNLAIAAALLFAWPAEAYINLISSNTIWVDEDNGAGPHLLSQAGPDHLRLVGTQTRRPYIFNFDSKLKLLSTRAVEISTEGAWSRVYFADSSTLWEIANVHSGQLQTTRAAKFTFDGAFVSSATLAQSNFEQRYGIAYDGSRVAMLVTAGHGNPPKRLRECDLTTSRCSERDLPQNPTAIGFSHGRIVLAGRAPDAKDGHLWVGDYDEAQGSVRKTDIRDVRDFDPNFFRFSRDGDVWIAGFTSSSAAVVVIDSGRRLKGKLSLAPRSYPKDIALVPGGGAWMTIEIDGRAWLGRISSDLTVLSSVTLTANLGGEVPMLRDFSGNVWIASGQSVWGNEQGLWVGRFLESTKTGRRDAGKLDFVFKYPGRSEEILRRSFPRIEQLMKAAQKTNPSGAFKLYEQAWGLANQIKEYRKKAEIDLAIARLKMKRKDYAGAADSLRRAVAAMGGGVTDARLWIEIIEAELACARNLPDRTEFIASKTRQLSNFHGRNMDATRQAQLRVEAEAASARKGGEWADMAIAPGLEADTLLISKGASASPEAYQTLGDAALAVRKMRTAAYFFGRGLAASTSGGETMLVPPLLSRMSKVNTSRGRFDLSIEQAKRALALAQKRKDAGGARSGYEALGYAYQQLGFDDSAIEYLQKAINIGRATGTDSAFAHMKMAQAYRNLDNETAALDAAVRADALGTREAIGDFVSKKTPLVTSSNGTSMGFYLMPGNDLLYGATKLDCYTLLSAAAVSCAGTTDFAGAEKHFNGAFETGERNGDDEVALAGLVGRGMALEGQERWVEALSSYRMATDRIEITRWLSPSDKRLSAYGASLYPGFRRMEPYEGMIRAARKIDPTGAAAFFNSEIARARTLSESIHAPDDDATGRHELIRETRRIEKEMLEGLGRIDASLTMTAGEREKERSVVAAKWAARAAKIEEIRDFDPVLAARHFPEPLPVGRIKLAPDEVLIEYAVTDPVTIVFAVRNGRIVAVKDIVIRRRKLRRDVEGYLKSFQGVRSKEDLNRYNPAAGRELYDTLLKPLIEARDNQGREIISKNDRLIIVPDDILRILPFESLPMTSPGRNEMPESRHGAAPLRITYVGDKYDVAYHHSATALTLQRIARRDGTARGALVLADPVFSPADSRSRELAPTVSGSSDDEFVTMGLTGIRKAVTAKVRGNDAGMIPRLDKTGVMARGLLAGAFAKTPVVFLEGAHATKSNLLKSDLEKKRYIVLATHGVIDGEIPGVNEPALLLTQYGNASKADAFLTSGEISKLRLNADIVALTACKTGLGKAVMGEGVMSMGRSFQTAGARSVLMSLWAVAEDSTSQLITSFFNHLESGKSKRTALRLARQDVRRAGFEHPYYWAPFILITD